MRLALLLAAMTAASLPCGAQDVAPSALVPDKTVTLGGAAGKMTVRVLIEQGSRALPVPNLPFTSSIGGERTTAFADATGAAFFACAAGEKVSAHAALTSDAFTIRPSYLRIVSVEGACGTETTLTYARANPGAAALRVWRVATSAKAKLDSEIGPAAWPKGATFFVSGGAATHGINVGVGADDTTFVVGHELGHAVSDHAGMIQQGFGDSYHMMTACIGDSGALEEGWASFFGAWVDQGIDELDPIQEWDQHSWDKRRLPIKTVPDSVEIGPIGSPQTAAVCKGTDNEMRVMSFLWNVVAADGVHAPFATLWRALAGSQSRSVTQVALKLQKLGVDPVALRRAWDAAFKTPCPV
jgi:hypothetical protein